MEQITGLSEAARILASARVQDALPEIEEALDLLEGHIDTEIFGYFDRGEDVDERRASILWARKHCYACLRRALTNRVKMVQALAQRPIPIPTEPPEE